MRSELRALRERILQVEAGGHRDTPLRRAYNRKLRAQRSLRGGGKPNLPADSQPVWEGSLTYARKKKVSYFELYDCGILYRYDENGKKFKESMVVFNAPFPAAVSNKSNISFIDGNGKRHDFRNPQATHSYDDDDFIQKLWENSVNGRIEDRYNSLIDSINRLENKFREKLMELK